MNLEQELKSILDKEDNNEVDEFRPLKKQEQTYMKNVYPIVEKDFSPLTPAIREEFLDWCKQLKPTKGSLQTIEYVYEVVKDNFKPINTREGFEEYHNWVKPLKITKKEGQLIQTVAPLLPLQFPKISELTDIPRFLDWIRQRSIRVHDVRVMKTASETYTPKHYRTVWTKKDLQDLVSWIKANEYIAIDTETDGVEKFFVNMVGMSLYSEHQGWYIPLRHIDDVNTSEWAKHSYNYRKERGEELVVGRDFIKCLSYEDVSKALKPVLEDTSKKFLFHNYAFDYHIIRRALGIKVGLYYDTQIGQKMLDESVSAALKDIAPKYLGIDADSFGRLFGNSVTFDTVPILEEPGTGRYNLTTKYAALDAELTYKMFQFQMSHLNTPHLAKIRDLVFNLELPFQRVVVEVEEKGVKCDVDYLKNTVEPHLYEQVEDNREVVFKYANKPFIRNQPVDEWKEILNLDSPDQLNTLLYKELKLPILTHDGKPSTNKTVLKKLAKEPGGEIAKAILDFRSVSKLHNDFAVKLQSQVTDQGRIHTSFRTLVSTGRMSSSEPNLQQMPSYTNIIRKAFISDPGRLLVSIDFSGQELRILGHISNDEKIINIFTKGGDMHSTTATGIHNNIIDRLTKSGSQLPVLDRKVTVDEFLRLREVASLLSHKDDTPNMELIRDKEYVQELIDKGILLTDDEDTIVKEIAEGQYCDNIRDKKAKAVNFSIVYGTTEHGLSDSLDIPTEEAVAYMEAYKETYPGVAKWMAETREILYKQEYVETLLGRKRRLYQQVRPYKQNPRDYSSKVGFEKACRQALNSPIQGSAADMVKTATLNLQDTLKKYDSQIVLFVHDEVIIDVPENIGYGPLNEFAEIMCNAIPLKTGMKSDIEIFRRWGERLRDEDLEELFKE